MFFVIWGGDLFWVWVCIFVVAVVVVFVVAVVVLRVCFVYLLFWVVGYLSVRVGFRSSVVFLLCCVCGV